MNDEGVFVENTQQEANMSDRVIQGHVAVVV